MKRIICTAALIAGCIFSYAQKTITGTIIDAASDLPLAGANISYSKGGTVTDKDGHFSIECGKANRITVSFLGYETVQQSIKNCDEAIRINLKPVSHSLNEVEITATSNQNKALIYQPQSITKLSLTEIKRGTGVFMDDAINTNVPGVTMNRRAVASGQQFNIRGYGNGTRGTAGVSSNFDGQGYKVYLNGIPVTDAEGITLMDDIDFGSIGNVEVVKGPSGTLFGLAIAGVVNLKTIKPEKGKTSIGQDVLVGSYGLRRYTTHFQTAGERSSVLVNYGRQETDGYMTHTNSDKRFINIAGDFQLNAKQTISSYFGYSNSYDQRGGELTVAQYDAGDYSGNPNYIKNNAHSEIIGFRAGMNHTYSFNNHISNSTTVFASGISNNASSAGGWTDKDPINYGLRSTFDTRFAIGTNLTLGGVTGIETQRQRAQIIAYAMVPDSNNLAGYNRIGAMRSNQLTNTGTTSVFTEWTLGFRGDLSLTTGLGWSNMKIELNDRFYVASANRAPSQFKRTFDDMFSPHVAINKVFSKQFSIYASYSKGYKAPASSYFYIPQTNQLNLSLKPEQGTQYEIGTKGSLLHNKLNYQLALFDAVFSDKMTAVAVTSGSTTLYTYAVNGGKQDDKGLEASLKYNAWQSNTGFFTSISPFANFTYSDFEYNDFKFQRNAGGTTVTEDYSNKKVAGVAKYMINAGFDLLTSIGIYANAYYSYKDPVYIKSDNTIKAKSYNLLNAKLGLKQSLGKHFDVDLYLGANNITDEKYYLMVFINQIPDAYLPAPKHAVYYGGLNLKYNF